MDILNPYTLQVVSFLVLNLILAISIYITLSTGQLSLGHAGFMSIGAYSSAILTKSAGVPLVAALLAAVLLTGLIAFLIGFPTLRLHGLYLAIATLGFGEVVRVIFINSTITHGALGLTGLQSIGNRLYDLEKQIGIHADTIGISVVQMKSLSTLVLLVLLFAVVLFMTLRLNRSRVGRAFSAIKADETAALAMGIPITFYKMLAFVIGAMLAGLAGGLYAHITTTITPGDFDYHRVVSILSYAVIGGVEVIAGPLFGGAFLTLLPEVLRVVHDYQMIFYGGLMVLVMAFRPYGLITTETFSRRGRRKDKGSSRKGEL